MDRSASEVAEDVVRASYGRLVAILAARSGDVAAAEDALSDALVAALRTWPTRGVPDRPEAWMLTAARRSLIGSHRRRSTAERALPALVQLADEQLSARGDAVIPDKRLELMFVCAHPALPGEIHAPLILQTVLGLDAVRIAEAFLVKPATLGQQLVRAKRRIAATGIPYSVPDAHQLADRLGSVLDAVYAAYGSGWDDIAAADRKRAGLASEAIRLARLITQLLPGEAEAHGLLALLLHSHARSAARRDAGGGFVALEDQDISRWSRPDIDEAERHLSIAVTLGVIGPYQLLAAIQSVHNRRAATGHTDWTAIATLHDGLDRLAPSIGGTVARAVAHLRAHGVDAARAVLDGAAAEAVEQYQPYWATLAEIESVAGNAVAAAAAASTAITLTAGPDVVDHLSRRYLDGRAGGRSPSSWPTVHPDDT